MINNIILIILFFVFVSGISYVFKRLKEETKNITKPDSDNLEITPEEIFSRVSALIDLGDHNTAQKLAKKYLNKNQDYHELRRLLIKSYMDKKKDHDAITHLYILSKYYPDDLDIFTNLANLYKTTHQHKKAMHYYAYILGKDQYNINAMKNLAELYYNNKQKESSLRLYKQVVANLEDETEKIQYYKKMADINVALNESETALELYKKVIEARPEHTEVMMSMRQIYLKLQDTENVLYLTRKLIDLKPANYNYYREITELLFHVKSYDEALTYAQKALELEQKDVYEIKNLIAKIYIYTNRIPEAISLLNEIIHENPSNIYLHQTLAIAYCMDKDFDTAIKVCKDALEIALPSDIKPLHNNISNILAENAIHLLNQGKNEKAFNKFTEALKYNNDNPEIYYKLSSANKSIKNYTEALRNCRRAIELAPEVSLYYEFLADIYYELQNFIEAKKCYKEAVMIDPRNVRAQTFLGILQAKNKENAGAAKSLEAAAAIEPDNPDIRYNLALVYELSGDVEHAINEYQKVLQLDPEHPDAKNNLKLLGEDIE